MVRFVAEAPRRVDREALAAAVSRRAFREIDADTVSILTDLGYDEDG